MNKIVKLCVFLSLFTAYGYSQNVDTIKNESNAKIKNLVDQLSKIKFSGFIQPQFQSAESDNASSYAGGDFPATTHNRFMVRRGYFKISYENDLSSLVYQIDITEKGINVKDAYATIKEPWLKALSLTAGQFNRPFGFEVNYSSGNLEYPDRTRFLQIILQNEKDIGAQVEFAPKTGDLSFIDLKVGLLNGNGPRADIDNNKDIAGRLGLNFKFLSSVELSLGASGYFGKTEIDNGAYGFALNNNNVLVKDSITKNFDRRFYGGDIQLTFNNNPLGKTQLRGEFATGKIPESLNATVPYTRGDGNLYSRKFLGYYIVLMQNIRKDLQFVAKYDSYDPNTDINGNSYSNSRPYLNAANIKYNTLGLGFNYYVDENVKLTAYYDIVNNEKISSANTDVSLNKYKNDLKDNILTLRMQYKF